jgi:hypothetical protein
MLMTRAALALTFGLIAFGAAPSPARADGSCFSYWAACNAVCTPQRAATYYAGSVRRCASSCEPRFQQCLRSGLWADLERLRTGGWEPGSIF